MSVKSLGGIVQNPNFAIQEDLDVFQDNCKVIEREYKRIKQDVIALFK